MTNGNKMLQITENCCSEHVFANVDCFTCHESRPPSPHSAPTEENVKKHNRNQECEYVTRQEDSGEMAWTYGNIYVTVTFMEHATICYPSYNPLQFEKQWQARKSHGSQYCVEPFACNLLSLGFMACGLWISGFSWITSSTHPEDGNCNMPKTLYSFNTCHG